METRSKWIVFMGFNTIIMGSQHPTIKALTETLSPILISFLRFFIAILFLMPFIYRKKIRLEKKDLINISIIGMLGIFLYSIIAVYGIKLTSSIHSSILLNTHPIITAFFAPLLINEKLSLKKSIGILIGFFGVLIIIVNGFNILNLFRTEYFIGNLLLIIGAFCISIYTIYNKKYIKKYGGLITTYYALICGTIGLFILTLLNKELTLLQTITVKEIILLIYLGGITTALAWVIWFKTIENIGVINTSPFFFLVPISGIILSNIFLNEMITLFIVIGTLFTLIGIYIIQKDNKSPTG